MMRITESQLRRIIRKEILREIDIGEVEGICMARGSTHVMNTCYIGGDRFHLKFSDESAEFSEATDPSLQILVEWLAYKIYSLYPGVDVPGRIELVYDRKNERVGIATSTVQGVAGYEVRSKALAAGLSAGVYVDVFLANWDIGNTSNIIVRPEDERPVRIDPGGALTFRARGSKKGRAFSDYPGELETMIAGSGAAADIFRHSDLKLAARTFVSVSWSRIESQISRCKDEVRGKLKEYGLDDLLSQWGDEIDQIEGKLRNRHREILRNVEFMKNIEQEVV